MLPYIIIAITTLAMAASGQGICTGMTSCFCKFENGQFLDISALGRRDGIPRFINVTDKAEVEYSWNPCFNFSEGSCREVSICAIQPALPTDLTFALGYQSTAQFSTDSNNSVQITYTTQGDGTTPVRRAHISLICNRESLQNMSLEAIGQKAPNSLDYYFELYSPLACPQGTPNEPSTTPKPKNTALSTSNILLICAGIVIVFVLVALVLAVLKIKGKICTKTEYDDL